MGKRTTSQKPMPWGRCGWAPCIGVARHLPAALLPEPMSLFRGCWRGYACRFQPLRPFGSLAFERGRNRPRRRPSLCRSGRSPRRVMTRLGGHSGGPCGSPSPPLNGVDLDGFDVGFRRLGWPSLLRFGTCRGLPPRQGKRRHGEGHQATPAGHRLPREKGEETRAAVHRAGNAGAPDETAEHSIWGLPTKNPEAAKALP